MLYLCNAFRDALRIKAAAQHSSSELGSAFALHFICIVKVDGAKKEHRTHKRTLRHLRRCLPTKQKTQKSGRQFFVNFV